MVLNKAAIPDLLTRYKSVSHSRTYPFHGRVKTIYIFICRDSRPIILNAMSRPLNFGAMLKLSLVKKLFNWGIKSAHAEQALDLSIQPTLQQTKCFSQVIFRRCLFPNRLLYRILTFELSIIRISYDVTGQRLWIGGKLNLDCEGECSPRQITTGGGTFGIDLPIKV